MRTRKLIRQAGWTFITFKSDGFAEVMNWLADSFPDGTYKISRIQNKPYHFDYRVVFENEADASFTKLRWC